MSERGEVAGDDVGRPELLTADRAPSPLGRIDSYGRCLASNLTWVRYTGREPDELRGDGWLSLLRPDDRAACVAACNAGAPFELDVRMRRADGRHRFAVMHAVPDGDAFDVAFTDVHDAREALRAAELFAALGDALNASESVESMLRAVASVMVHDLADLCSIAVRNPSGAMVRAVIAHRDADVAKQLDERYAEQELDATDGSALADVMQTGTVLYRPLVDAPGPDEPWPPLPDDFVDGRARSLICVPLRTADDVAGALALVTWSYSFGPDDVGLAQEVAHRCAVALDHRMRFRRSEQARARLTLLAGVGEQLAATLDLADVLRTVVGRVVPAFADAATVALLDDDEITLRRYEVAHVDDAQAARFRETHLGEPIRLDGSNPCARVARSGRPLLIEDFDGPVPTRPRRRGFTAERALAARSLLEVPIQGPHGSLGVITLAFADSGRRYTASDVPLGLDLARRAAVAIERARAYDEERRVAEALQHSMLPDTLPDVPSFEFCAKYMPGGRVDVGGDWYDVVPLADGRYGIVIGDVVGHGVRAATVMGQLRHALRAFASDGGGAAHVVGRLNRYVFEQGPTAMATLCYGVLDPTTGTLELSLAGHVPPLVSKPATEPRFVDVVPAPPIGAEPGSQYDTAQVALDVGATVLFYTDGLIERRGESLDDGFARLIERAAEAPAPLADTCAFLVEHLVGPARPRDDVALLALRFVADGRGHVRIRRPARAAELSSMRRVLRARLQSAGVPPEDIGIIAVAVTEAATNSIEHAYGLVDGWFEVDAEVKAAEVEVIVRDAGRWRPKAPGGGGRGLALIGRLMDEFEVRRSTAGTEVWMRRGIGGKE